MLILNCIERTTRYQFENFLSAKNKKKEKRKKRKWKKKKKKKEIKRLSGTISSILIHKIYLNHFIDAVDYLT